MRYIAVSRCRIKGKTDILHYLLFHGDASRNSIPDTKTASHFLNDDLSELMKIRCCGVNIPSVFQPDLSLVVSEDVKNILNTICNVKFAEVLFSKLVNYSYKVGDFSYYDSPQFKSDPNKNRSDKILDILPDDPNLHNFDKHWHELVVTNMARINNSKSKSMSIRMPDIFEDIEICYSPSHLNLYPIFWYDVILFNRSVFDLIFPYINLDFFSFAEVDL